MDPLYKSSWEPLIFPNKPQLVMSLIVCAGVGQEIVVNNLEWVITWYIKLETAPGHV